MAGWSTRGTDRDVGQHDADASLILVSARDVSFYSLFFLALDTWWSGPSQACFAPAVVVKISSPQIIFLNLSGFLHE